MFGMGYILVDIFIQSTNRVLFMFIKMLLIFIIGFADANHRLSRLIQH